MPPNPSYLTFKALREEIWFLFFCLFFSVVLCTRRHITWTKCEMRVMDRTSCHAKAWVHEVLIKNHLQTQQREIFWRETVSWSLTKEMTLPLQAKGREIRMNKEPLSIFFPHQWLIVFLTLLLTLDKRLSLRLNYKSETKVVPVTEMQH